VRQNDTAPLLWTPARRVGVQSERECTGSGHPGSREPSPVRSGMDVLGDRGRNAKHTERTKDTKTPPTDVTDAPEVSPPFPSSAVQVVHHSASTHAATAAAGPKRSPGQCVGPHHDVCEVGVALGSPFSASGCVLATE